MKWSSVLSTKENLEAAIAEASSELLENLEHTPSVVFVFLSPFYHLHFDRAPELFKQFLPDSVVVGCAACGIFAGGIELEDAVGVGMVGAYLPEVEVVPFYMKDSHTDPLELVASVEAEPQLVLFSDPLTFDHGEFLTRLNAATTPLPIIGGLASGASETTYNVLFLNDTVYKSGAVGLILTGNIMLEQFVSQGSKGLGAPCFATRVRGNVIYELDGYPAELVLGTMLESIDEAERLLFEESGLMGIYEDTHCDERLSTTHDVRQIIGIDDGTSSIILDEPIAENSIVRILIGDPYQSHEFLIENLKRYKQQVSDGELSGALVFSCARRGEGFYNDQGHETTVFKETFESLPLGGFYSFGELVQEKGKARICGLSSAFGFFKPRRPS